MRSIVLTAGLVLSVLVLLLAPSLRPRTRAVEARSDATLAEHPPTPEFPLPSEPWAVAAVELAAAGQCVRALDDLGALAPDSSSAARARHLFLAGTLARRHGDDERAQAAFTELLEDPASRSTFPLAAHAAHELGLILEEAGELDAARKQLAWSAANAPSLLEPSARLAWARVLAESGRAGEARRAIARLLGTAPRSFASWPAALALAAELADDAGDAAAARLHRERLFFEHAGHEEAQVVARRADFADAVKAAVASGRVGAVLARAEALSASSQAQRAVVELETVLETNLEARDRDRALVLLARALRKEGHGAKAIARLRTVTGADAELASEATYLCAQAARSLRRTGEARRFLVDATHGPRNSWRDRAALELGEQEKARRDASAAQEAWLLVARDGVTPATRARARWLAGWSQFREDDSAAALETFDELVLSTPRAREAAAALYWSARILRAGGDEAAATQRLVRVRAEFPNDYYGALAGDELGMAVAPPAVCQDDEVACCLSRAMAVLASRDAAAACRIAELYGLELHDLALVELGALVAGARAAGDDAAMEAGWQATVIVQGRAGRHDDALRTFRSAVPDWRSRTDVPSAVWCSVYPLAFQELILPNAESHSIDPALVLALVHQESVFSPLARSWVGARGLMQIMPATGKTIARWVGEGRSPDLLDPELNVRYGTLYLKRLLDEFERPELALAGYNAGGGRVRRWSKEVPEGDIPLFVESIPFDETRDYVKSVCWNRFFYQGAYFDAAAYDGETQLAQRLGVGTVGLR